MDVSLTAPMSASGTADVADAEMTRIVTSHGTTCHACAPTDVGFKEAPKDIRLETLVEPRQHAPLVRVQAVQSDAMLPGNETRMTAAEREKLGAWLRAQPQ